MPTQKSCTSNLNSGYNKYVDMANEPRPFKTGMLYFSKEGDHGIAFYYMRNNNDLRVAALSRRLYFDEKGKPAAPIREALVEKYGPTDWSKGNTLLWVTAPRLRRTITWRTLLETC